MQPLGVNIITLWCRVIVNITHMHTHTHTTCTPTPTPHACTPTPHAHPHHTHAHPHHMHAHTHTTCTPTPHAHPHHMHAHPHHTVTTGPLPKTVVDLWRLIWQERPTTVVMVTNLKEGTHTKCQQYWPDSGQIEFGPFQVIITDQQVFADYTVRTLSLSVRQCHQTQKF